MVSLSNVVKRLKNISACITYTFPLMPFDKFGLKIDLESIIESEMVPMIDSEFLDRFRTLVYISDWFRTGSAFVHTRTL